MPPVSDCVVRIAAVAPLRRCEGGLGGGGHVAAARANLFGLLQLGFQKCRGRAAGRWTVRTSRLLLCGLAYWVRAGQLLTCTVTARSSPTDPLGWRRGMAAGGRGVGNSGLSSAGRSKLPPMGQPLHGGKRVSWAHTALAQAHSVQQTETHQALLNGGRAGSRSSGGVQVGHESDVKGQRHGLPRHLAQ